MTPLLMARDIHPDWRPRAPGTPPSLRPKGVSDAERALWWRTTLPTRAEADAWIWTVRASGTVYCHKVVSSLRQR